MQKTDKHWKDRCWKERKAWCQVRLGKVQLLPPSQRDKNITAGWKSCFAQNASVCTSVICIKQSNM